MSCDVEYYVPTHVSETAEDDFHGQPTVCDDDDNPGCFYRQH